MIVLRYLLPNTATFNLRRALPTEPIAFLVSMMILKAVLVQYYPRFQQGLKNCFRKSKVGINATILGPFGLSFILAPVLSQDVTVSLLESIYGPQQQEQEGGIGEENSIVMTQTIWRAGSALGSALTVNGNLHNLLIVLCLAYDDISWFGFFLDMLFPLMTVFILSFFILLILGCARQMSASKVETNHQDYQNFTTDDETHAAVVTNEKPPETVTNPEAAGEVDPNHTKAGSTVETSAPLDGTTANVNTQGVSNTGLLVDTKTEEIGDAADVQQATLSPFIVVSAMIVLFLGYLFGRDVILMTCFVVMALFWIGWCRNPGCGCSVPWSSSQQQQQPSDVFATWKNSFLSRLDFDVLFVYIGVTILTQSWNDTGMPGYILYRLGGECYNKLYMACVMPQIQVVYWFAVIFSPLTTVLVLATSYPYDAPYYWIQYSLCLSMATMTRSMLQDTFWYCIPKIGMTERSSFSWLYFVPYLFIAFTLPIFFLRICITLSAHFHFTAECSERLGECGMY